VTVKSSVAVAEQSGADEPSVYQPHQQTCVTSAVSPALKLSATIALAARSLSAPMNSSSVSPPLPDRSGSWQFASCSGGQGSGAGGTKTQISAAASAQA
jgi:hypothetical protein